MQTEAIDIDEINNLINLVNKIDLTEEMTEQQLNTLVNHLKLPDCIKDLPVYKGNRTGLHDFIENVDEIVKLCEELIGRGKIPSTYLRAIRNKIQGEADEVLTMYGTELRWETIKNNLVNHYSDKRNETSLIKDLHSLYQGNDTIERFFSRIIEIQSALITHVKLHDADETVRKAKETLYTEMCLNSFLAGIKEPLGSMIRARKPTNIADAYNLCIAEQNMFYLKNKMTTSSTSNNNQYKKPLPPLPSRNIHLNPQIFQNRFEQKQNQPNYYNHQPFKPNYNTTFRHNFQPTFKPPAILPPKISNPEPMDTRSIQEPYKQYSIYPPQNRLPNVNQHSNKFNFQSSGPPRFKSKEIYNIEIDPETTESISNPEGLASLEYPYEPDPSYIPLPEEVDDEDFRDNASQTPLGS